MKIRKNKKSISNFIRRKNPAKHFLIFFIWLFGLFLRIYRQDQLLGFHYDQGRDATIANEIITGKNFPAIGPTTGIEGLYLGPFWFYLITPGYLLGKGNPAIASYFIIFLESLSIPLFYFLLKKYWTNSSAILTSFLWASSHYIIRSSRWFSNPSSIPTFSLLIIFLLSQIFINKKKRYWPILALFLGLSLQLEAASAIFFIPTILFLLLINHRQNTNKRQPIINLKQFLQSVFAFLFLLLPQLVFEIKNKFLITKNFLAFLSGKTNTNTGKSWAMPTFSFIKQRLLDYYAIFFTKLDTNLTKTSIVFLIIFSIGTFYLIKKHRKNTFIQIILAWLFIPLFCLLFFVGNFGQLYDYYLTGFFPAFFIIFSIIISLPKLKFSKLLFVTFTLSLFFLANFTHLKNYLIAGTNGPRHISLGNQKQTIEYLCEQTKNQEYNIDIYVPPVIPHSYNYLLYWYQKSKNCQAPKEKLVPLLYTIYEVDLPHPERLEAWLKRQEGIGKTIEETSFGGITIQKRTRIND
ncbi:glycosyltransferase family 39 protein [Patescibacteria group bacterium]|nr:glycosyltransferase family 39 protein [Patescibacteria group bacterium]